MKRTESRRGVILRALSWSALWTTMLWLALCCQPAAADLLGTGVGATATGCDPTTQSCAPPTCTLQEQLEGLCKAGDPEPGGPGTGGVCTAAPGGNPGCSPASGPTTTPGGTGGDVQVGGGNPINLVSGNKYQLETDLAPLPGVLGLELRRHYNSLSAHAGLVGAGWHMSYETVLYDEGSQIQVVQADGQRLMFQRGFGAQAALCTTPRPQDGQVRIVADAHGVSTYVWRWPDGRTLTFSSGSGGGHPLQTITAPGGEQLTVTYSPSGELVQVRDPQGRKLSFIYGGPRNVLQAIDTPLGRVDYTIDAQGRLTQASRRAGSDAASASTRIYHYEDRYNGGNATALTGISLRSVDAAMHKEIEQRLSTYAYASDGRAVLTTKGEPRQVKDGKPVPGTGIEQVDVAYITKPLPSEGRPDKTGEVHPRQFGRTVITNSLGQQSELLSALIGGHFRLMQMTGPGCSTCGPGNMRYAYNRAGQVLRATRLDAAGQPMSADVTEYDAHGRVLRTGVQADAGAKAPSTRWLQRYEYADTKYPDGSLALAPQPSLIARPGVIAGKEHIVRFAYNDVGQPQSISEEGFSPIDDQGRAAPQGVALRRTTSYRYVRIGTRTLLSEIDGPLPNGPQNSPADSDITRFEYDAQGLFVSRIVEPGQRTTQYGPRDAAGLPSSVTYLDGAREIVEKPHRNAQGLVDRVVASARLTGRDDSACASCGPSTQTTQIAYDDDGRPVSTIDPAGRVVHLRYDLADRLVEREDGQGYAQHLDWDTEDRLHASSLHEPGQSVPLRASYMFYDALGNMSARLSPDGRIDRYIPVPRRSVEAFEADLSRLAPSGFAPDGKTLSASTRAAAAMPRERSSDSDDFGHVRIVRAPHQVDRAAVYDTAGAIVRLIYGDGRAIDYRRGLSGELLEKTVLDAAGQVVDRVTVHYAGSVLSEVDDPVQSTRYEHDAWGRLVTTKVRIKALSGKQSPFVFGTQFEPQSDLPDAQTLADGEQLLFDRDSAAKGRTTRAVALRSRFWTRVASILPQRWAHWLPTAPVLSDIVVHPFDGLQRATFGNGIVLSRDFDIAGRITAMRVDAKQARLYDAAYRYGAGPRIDEVDGRLLGEPFATRVEPQPAAAPALTQATWRPAAFDAAARGPVRAPVERDADGRLLTDGEFRYVYTWQGQIEQVANLHTGSIVARYTYNAGRQRVSKTVAGRTTYFLWDAGRVVAEIDEAGAITRQYVYLTEGGAAMPVAEIETLSGESARLLAIHTDHRGAPVEMTDSHQHVVWKARVDAYGHADVLAADPSARAATLDLRLPGQYFDDETGLHDNFNRSYDPRTAVAGERNPNRARYLQPDPLGLPGDSRTYLYGNGDPLNKIDPLGLYESDVHYYMTYFLAIAAGVNPDDARVVALGDQYVDDNDATTPVDGTNWLTTVGSIFVNQPKLLDYHFVLNGSNGKVLPGQGTNVADPSSPQLTNLFNASANAPTPCAKDQFFGEALHAFEDTFAHRNKLNKPYDALKFGLGIGHGFDGKNPDFTYNHGSWTVNEDRTLEMELEVFHQLQSYGQNTQHSTITDVDLVVMLKQFNAIHENGDGTHEYGETGGSIADSKKIVLLNNTLQSWGFTDINMTNANGQGYDKATAASDRDKFLCTAGGQRFSAADYRGTILPTNPCP